MNQRSRWRILPPAPEDYLRSSLLSPVAVQLLYNRGIQPDDVDAFLQGDERLQGDPYLLPDITQAVNRVYAALLSGETIAVYGDFDVDGITATVIVAEALSWLGAKVIPYIPDRFEDGHGLNIAAVGRLREQGAGLLVTVDCGVTNTVEVEQAREMGMDVVITDHHVPPDSLPRAAAVVDPKRQDCSYPYRELAGAGVAFKVVQALLRGDRRGEQLGELRELVALATVADVVPLVGENRYMVREGLKELNRSKRIGLQELIRSAGLTPGSVNARDIAWTLGPRINAAGRIDDASTGYRLLTTDSPEEAALLATDLGQKNEERQQTTRDVLDKVKERLVGKMERPLFIEAGEDYPVGVIGLVAGRLVDEFYKPAILISLGPDICRGSSRSIREFDMVAALDQCKDLLGAYGGHPMAAGFSVTPENLRELEERISRIAVDQLGHLDLRPELVIDAEIALSAFAGDARGVVRSLSPFGAGNPEPVFLTREVEVLERRNFGSRGEWLRLKLRQGEATWAAVDFESHRMANEVPPLIDVAYHLDESQWNGATVLSLKIRDFAASQAQ